MTNFEREEIDIIWEADFAKKNTAQLIKDGLLDKEAGYLALNDKLIMLQKRWFQLHRKLVEG